MKNEHTGTYHPAGPKLGRIVHQAQGEAKD